MGADLDKANLTGAKHLGLEQVKEAKNWDKAIYDSDFRKQLGLAPIKPSKSEQPG